MTVWSELNERQRTCLRALFDCDQSTEQARRQLAARGFWDRTPAAEWRWVLYGPVAPPAPLWRTLATVGVIDEGTGATWAALERRGLLKTRTRREELGDFLEVQLTPAGRKLVRLAIGVAAPKRQPVDQLRERQWVALVRLAAAGEMGIDNDTLLYGPDGFDWWNTIRRLVEYKPAALIAYQGHPGRYVITAAGQAFVARERVRYAQLYPEVKP